MKNEILNDPMMIALIGITAGALIMAAVGSVLAYFEDKRKSKRDLLGNDDTKN